MSKKIDIEAIVKKAREDERAKMAARLNDKIRKAVIADAERRASALQCARQVYSTGLAAKVRLEPNRRGFVKTEASEPVRAIKRGIRGSRAALSRAVAKGARLSGISEAEIRVKMAEVRKKMDPDHVGQGSKSYQYDYVPAPKGVGVGYFAWHPAFCIDGAWYQLFGSHDGTYELRQVVKPLVRDVGKVYTPGGVWA